MVRSILIIIIALVTLLLTGASYKNAGADTPKKYCRGYSVIAVDKGIDCNGDTIKLVKLNGYFERLQ